jgi:hypothetical protein
MSKPKIAQRKVAPMKDCPFCGSKPTVFEYTVECVNIHCLTQPQTIGDSLSESIEVWNKRVPNKAGRKIAP